MWGRMHRLATALALTDQFYSFAAAQGAGDQEDLIVALFSTAFGIVLLIVMVVVFLFIWFIPTFIAIKRDCQAKLGIIVINIFGAACAGLGWVVALVWALVGRTRAEHRAMVYGERPQ